MNTDNRIIAAATKYAFHDYIEMWVSNHPKGFLNGRSMNEHIIILDIHTKMYSLQETRPAMVLFDFRAAFPSVSHELMWRVLEMLGIWGSVAGHGQVILPPAQAVRRR